MIVRELIWALGFRFDSSDLDKAERGLQKTDQGARQLVSSLRGGLNVLSKWVTRLATVGAAIGGAFLVRTIMSFEQLRAQLVTLEQDAGKAEAAFQMLQDFATTTPFQLQNVIRAFATLRGSGINPTTDDLRVMGDMAAGMGKDITDVSEAFAKASIGNFELLRDRLKVAVTQSGGQVTLAFGDFKKTVKKDGKAIQAALLELGRSKFAGGMERQMDTIGGAVSNLMDNLAKFADAVGRSGLSREINAFTRELTDAAGEGDGLAATLGETLGDGVRFLRDAFRFLRENADEVVTVLKVLGAILVGNKIVGGLQALLALLTPIAAAMGLGVLPFLLLTALVVGFGLAVGDLITFLEGGETVIGKFFEAVGIGEEAGRVIAGFILALMALPFVILGFIPTVITALIVFWDDIVELFDTGVQKVKEAWSDFWENTDFGTVVKDALISAFRFGVEGLKAAFPTITTGVALAQEAGQGIAGLIGGGAADPGVDAARRLNEVNNNRREVNVSVTAPVQVDATGGSTSVVDDLRTGLQDALSDLFSGAAADLEGSFD